MEFFEKDDIDALILADEVLTETVLALAEATNNANHAVHDWILNHGGEPQPRNYFSIVQDRRQLRLIAGFMKT
jgi:hypothetical protein